MSGTTKGLQLRSLIKKSGELELSLAEVLIPEPGPDQVLVKVEATPINPSDLGLLVGPADMSTAKASGSGAAIKITAKVPEQALPFIAARLDQAMPVSNEGAAEHRVILAKKFRLRDSAVGIEDVSEHDGVDRANLLTGRLDRTIRNSNVSGRSSFRHLHLVLDLRILDALRAVRALLHDTTHANRDFWILHHLHQLGHALWTCRAQIKTVEVALVVIEEIESTNLVRAIVRAIAGADAAIVGHRVEAFFVVHRRIHRAYGLTRRELAMHTEHWLQGNLGIFRQLAITFATERSGICTTI